MSKLIGTVNDDFTCDAEGEVMKFQFTHIRGTYELLGKDMSLPEDDMMMNWEFLITDKRVILKSPFITSLVGSKKTKPGKITIGWFDYDDITGIGIMPIMGVSDSFLLTLTSVTDKDDDDTMSIEVDLNGDDINKFFTTLVDRYNNWCQLNPKFKSNKTVFNFKNATIKDYPEIKPTALLIEDGLPLVYDITLNGDIVKNTELTDLEGYSEADVKVIKGCSSCGANIAAHATFCPACGVKQS